jgi:hypothetical protein
MDMIELCSCTSTAIVRRAHVYRVCGSTRRTPVRGSDQIEQALQENTRRLMTLRPPLDPSNYAAETSQPTDSAQPAIVEPLPPLDDAGPTLDLNPSSPATQPPSPRPTPVPPAPADPSPAVPEETPANLPPLPESP